MTSLIAWAVVTAVLGAAVSVTLTLGESVRPGGLLAPVRRRTVAVPALLGLVLLLATALRLRPLAEADGALVRLLTESRGDALTDVMRYLTLMGDPIPTLVLATALALVLQHRGGHGLVPWLLPILMAVEIVAQAGVGTAIGPLTIADIHPEIVLDGEGYLPSGALARLSALTLCGSYLLWPTAPRAASGLVSVGSVLLLVEAVTRLYLARHLGLDLLGGLVLGLTLFLALTVLVPHPGARAARPER